MQNGRSVLNKIWESNFKNENFDKIIVEVDADFYYWDCAYLTLEGPYKCYLDVLNALYVYGEKTL